MNAANAIVLPQEFRPAKSEIAWTDEQQLMHSHMAVQNQRQSLMMNALAGTGKTSSTLYGVNTYMGWASTILLTAFGVEAAAQMQAKLKRPGADALNFHKIGFRALAKLLPTKNGKQVKINTNGAKYKIHDMVDIWLLDQQQYDKEEACEAKDTFVSLVNFARLNLTDVTNAGELAALCEVYGLTARPEIFKALPSVIARSDKMALEDGLADFTDMIYLPVKYNATFQQYDAVIVDEAQDLSRCTMIMTLRSVKEGGFYMVIGDPNQAIMMFAGAVGNGWETIRNLMTYQFKESPRELKLSICQRCSVVSLNKVNEYYPEIGIQPRANAPEGVYMEVSATYFPDIAQPGDAIGCRFNRPLFDMYFAIIEAGKEPWLKGVSEGICKAMIKLLEKVAETPGYSFDNIEMFVERYRAIQISAMEKRKADPYKIQDMEENFDCLIAVIHGTDGKALDTIDVIAFIRRIGEKKPTANSIMLTTWHRFKGGEANRVMMLDTVGKLPLVRTKMNEEQMQQERNIHYVALTRAKTHYYVNAPGNNDVPPEVRASYEARMAKNPQRVVKDEAQPVPQRAPLTAANYGGKKEDAATHRASLLEAAASSAEDEKAKRRAALLKQLAELDNE